MAAGEQQDTGQSEQAELEDGWGHLPSQERQDELDTMLREWEQNTDHGERRSAFDDQDLTGSDVFFLTARSVVGLAGDVREVLEGLQSSQVISVPDLHLEGAGLSGAHLDNADLGGAHLDSAFLSGAHLERADLGVAHLEGTVLSWAHLEGTDLGAAHLEGADLSYAHLEGADLRYTSLDTADLTDAHLEGADLRHASMEGTDLSDAHLEGAVLRGASLDKNTQLNGTLLDRASLDQTIFDNTNLAVVPWNLVHLLGDEIQARTSRDDSRKRKPRAQRRRDYEAAVRAHRQLAARLADQGMIEQANRFIYRALILQRKSHRFYLPRSIGTWTFSWILYLLAGYGYRPMRTLFWYLATIAGYAALFYAVTHGVVTFGLPASQVEPLHWYEALILSVSSFHGRGFFQPLQRLGDPVAVVAAVEAVFGLFIEVSFIATFTQRFFTNR